MQAENLVFSIRRSRSVEAVTKPNKQRQRLAPEVRRSNLLDHAADIVAAEGVSACTMERVGQEAGVSKSLVYVYFPGATELLQELLQRELKTLRRKQAEAAEEARTFADLVRMVTHVYLTYIKERGLLIHRLQSEPSVAQGTGDPADFSRDVAVKYLAEIVSKNFDIPIDLAMPATAISFGLPIAAGNYLDASDADFRSIEDLTVTMIIGSIEALASNYTAMHKPLVRNSGKKSRRG